LCDQFLGEVVVERGQVHQRLGVSGQKKLN
jgi:hypothetical protein